MDPTASSSPRSAFGTERGPRPEATALKWHDLLPTTQDALEELITWLHSASGTAVSGDSPQHQEKEEQLATSALVSGDRGFGKTTILLSASYALRVPHEFLKVEPQKEPTRLSLLSTKLGELHQRLVWLDALDMEPIPAQANLLATLLVRVRNALDSGRNVPGRERWAPPSLLEEGLDDPYGKIDKLVRDATFMWEDIQAQGQDPRQRADQQIKAAEIYATFRQNFFKAMDAVSSLLAARRFGQGSENKRVLLVLPIDNVDRSIQHLHLILKLTRMVASRRLWFVLAAGRAEFQLFLERTFQAELSSSGHAPLGTKAREETLSIARRQAAAAMRRVLPPIHRIQIASVTPRAAWEFRAAPILAGGDAQDTKCLADFLKDLYLAGRTQASPNLKYFADLFDVRGRLGDLVRAEYLDVLREQSAENGRGEQRAKGADGQSRTGSAEQDGPIFTYAARLALTLSARTALDLWQSLKAAHQQKEQCQKTLDHAKVPCPSCAERVIHVAEGMLRTAIDESELPAWASEQLLNRIMRRNTLNRVVLDLTGKPVRKLKRTTLSDVLEWNPQWSRQMPDRHAPSTHPPQSVEGHPLVSTEQYPLLRTELHLRHFQDDILELHDLDKPGRAVPLPPAVAGWFMLLHDLLVLTQEGRVMNVSFIPLETAPELVVTVHQALLQPSQLTELDFWWLPPSWDTFIDFSIFVIQWRAFLHRTTKLFQPAGDQLVQKEFAEARFNLVMAAWIDNVCSVASEHRGRWDWAQLTEVVPPGKASEKVPGETLPPRRFDAEELLPNYQRAVATRVENLFARAREQSGGYDTLWISRLWLEQTLPLMLHPEFLPPPFLTNHEWLLKEMEEKFPVSLWKSIWQENNPFIEARRRELVIEVLERSRTFQAYQEAARTSRGFSARFLRGWLHQSCDKWLETVGDLETEGERGIKL
ncbi:hypothetical protein [Hyalangium rubrum]|uniref:Uncharacterized protein n=1 Tax=Hyalangium rubrum TaxID=3103134 RepID=A0ABU5HB67_9BACT|nr:hypothetical protein [Hyalangium sp. s54d21]MDY7230037.1 hypothetical protein [Hyalangium sp. s54d21]